MARVFLAIMTILAVVSLGIVGTYAGFVDTEVSPDNSIQASSLDLLLENPESIGEQWGQSVLRTWHWENLAPPKLMEPGDSLTSEVYLKAVSTVVGHHVDITAAIVNYEPDPDTDAENLREAEWVGGPVDPTPNHGIFDKDTVMIITYLKYHTNEIISSEFVRKSGYFTDTSGDGRISLAEFKAQGLHGLTPVPNAGTITFSMTVKFADDDTYNQYQGDGSIVTFIFLLVQ